MSRLHGVTRLNDQVQLPGRLQQRYIAQNRDGGPVNCNFWFGPLCHGNQPIPLHSGHNTRGKGGRSQPDPRHGPQSTAQGGRFGSQLMQKPDCLLRV